MKMTLNDYIQNPMGKENAVFSQREMYRQLYTTKLDKIMVREAGTIQYFLYKDNDSRYLVHIKVPSEVVEKFYYDTVIEFYTEDPLVINDDNLNKYFVKFYSNDPSFVYTFAHAFLKNDLFIRDLIPRMSKMAVENAAKVKNPKNIVGYVKSLYFAYLIMRNKGLMKKVMFSSYGKKYNIKELLNSVEKADIKISNRQEAEKLLHKRRNISHTKDKKDDNSWVVKSAKNTHSVRSTGSTSRTKLTKGVKTTKTK